ncbi:chromate efflux transporter [Massilia timonae]|uniref:Chromate efflux transporter family protein n=1 Tax=Massilia timonae TaxID=47229 RepID=A0A1S2NBQ7_9BURK|nr:chromate efflux transporter [Massilia timonae]OIJ42429.1 chromate efflux transporter family protein [Massilia timonae]
MPLQATATAALPIWSIFWTFLKLGLTSFGGPIAHLGYYRNEFVLRRRWLDDARYGDLVALCQFLPGPASSQVGFALGVLRGGGLAGGLAAWIGFTLPSALLMFAFALGAASLVGLGAAGLVHGLKLVAVAVVAQAVWGMARTLTPDRRRIAIALGAIAIVVLVDGPTGQLAAIAAGAGAGYWLCRGPVAQSGPELSMPVSRRAGIAALALFGVLLLALPLLCGLTGHRPLALFDAFYRSGALVFGGGHVVLPLLQAETVATGWIPNETFLAGYGLAQALPGPLFAFAAFLGAQAGMTAGAPTGAALALLALFLPGLLLVYGTLPFWDGLRRHAAARHAMMGANAAVVGILAAALYHPVWTAAVFDIRDAGIALGGFMLLTLWKAPSWIVVILLVALGAVGAS